MYTVKYYNIARLFMREFMHDGQADDKLIKL